MKPAGREINRRFPKSASRGGLPGSWFRGLVYAALLFIGMLPGLAHTQSALAEEEPELPVLSPASESFLIANVLFTLLHEFGHVIIRDFEVPLLGLEENSADTIAAVSLVLLDRQDPGVDFARALWAAALAQALIWKTGLESENLQELLWAQHQLSAQRFARLACLLYGSDPERFDGLVERAHMSEIRADYCEDEWAAAERGVRWVRDTYGHPPGAGDAGVRDMIVVKYRLTTDPRETALRELLERDQLLEKIAEHMQQRFTFPEPLTLRLRGCGSPGAYWDYEYRELVLCYELMQAYIKMAKQPEVLEIIEGLNNPQ